MFFQELILVNKIFIKYLVNKFCMKIQYCSFQYRCWRTDYM